MENEENRIRVLIYPKKERFIAVCLDLCAVAREKTIEESAKSIANLINTNISEEIKRGHSFERMRKKATQDIQDAYNNATTFSYSYCIPTKLKDLLKGIDYKFYPEEVYIPGT